MGRDEEAAFLQLAAWRPDLARVAAGLNNRFRDYVMSYQLDADTAEAMRQMLARHAQAAKINQGL